MRRRLSFLVGVAAVAGVAALEVASGFIVGLNGVLGQIAETGTRADRNRGIEPRRKWAMGVAAAAVGRCAPAGRTPTALEFPGRSMHTSISNQLLEVAEEGRRYQ